jgi:hypothetical protein
VPQSDDCRVEVARLFDLRIDPDVTKRVHFVDLRAGHEAGHVEVVHGHVEEEPSGEPEIRQRGRSRVAARDADEVELAHLAGCDRRVDRRVRGVEAPIETHL